MKLSNITANWPGAVDLSSAVDSFLVAPGETVQEAALRLGLFNVGEVKSANKTITGRADVPRPLTVSDTPEVVPREVKAVIETMDRLGYTVFRSGKKNYDLNLVGLRSENSTPNAFDDELMAFWKWENRWLLKRYKITTDPGLTYLTDPENKHGTAILKEGQYRSSHRLGKHKGKYEALVQAKPLTVIRDFNRDKLLDFASGKEQTGIFGINIHRATANGESTFVNKWSAGCQVFARSAEYNEFIKLCKLAIAEWGNSFTYTLLRRKEVGL
ncbi:hypothetical protein KK062_25675 [Fulvivirgaceae bacterium PWU5]|uniref:Uncharacterized protein n=1 Tax=Dawidia cretensis TaxID=2782350 RepID=A0AAP2GSY7_9BACT|nr:hypothetical protein [Dawidia cretensis]MBT1711659.1 hypothetical protein [Dawidia cretensis]